MPAPKSFVDEMASVQLAIELIELGARLQVVESETDMCRPHLIRLYKEIRGTSPPKGLLPFSTDPFMTWSTNIHASLFYSFYLGLLRGSPDASRMSIFTKAYRLYQEQLSMEQTMDAELGITRAWTLIRFFENDMLEQIVCSHCGGGFIAHAHTPSHSYVCGLCQPPSRAGKTLKGRATETRKAQAKALDQGVHSA
jgi:flagellar transcriptional activator FlhC